MDSIKRRSFEVYCLGAQACSGLEVMEASVLADAGFRKSRLDSILL